MKLAIVVDGGQALELRWMWMPAFISQNYGLMSELRQDWKKEHPQGVEITAQTHEEAVALSEQQAHDWTIDWLTKRLNIKGLDKYLRAIEYVEET